MTTELFSVFDSAAKRYLEPFYAPTIEYAIRQFRASINTGDHMFARFPEDYVLFHIGSFDQESGQVVANAAPMSLGVAVTFLDVPMNGSAPVDITREPVEEVSANA